MQKRIHSSILESSVRRASSQRRLRVRGGAWESHPGSLGVFSGLGSLSFSSRETVRANSHETSPKMPHALATGNISKRLRRRESKTSAVLDGAVRFLLTVSAFLYPSSLLRAGALDAHSHARAARRTPELSRTRPRTPPLGASSTPTAFAASAHAATPPKRVTSIFESSRTSLARE